MTSRMIFLLLSVMMPACSAFGYGEKVDTLLIWQERAVLVLTNACRMAPVAFRDRYIGNNTILLPENYPSVAPLYWNGELNAASRFHCVEMGLTCGMSHDCGGVTFAERVKKFYTKSSTIGENIAAGYQTPQQVVAGWLIDGQSAATAAPDGNGDGHRANIMSPRYREIGCGFYLSGSGRTATPYWCQDFGGGRSAFSYHPVSAASHLFFSKGQITFWAAIHDTTGTVADVSLVLDGTKTAMALDLGVAYAGTYAVTLPAAAACRNYAVEIVCTDGRTLRYPETGTLSTVGEGTCVEGGAGTFSAQRSASEGHVPHAGVRLMRYGGAFALTSPAGSRIHPASTTVITCKGSRMALVRWNAGIAFLPSEVCENGGILLFRHAFPDGACTVSRHMPVR